jgi:HEAT repeat protein
MLDLGHLQESIRALATGNYAARRQAIHSLKDYDEKDWATAPSAKMHALLPLLLQELLREMKQTTVRQEALGILANMGPRAAPALSQLIELLKEENPNGIREAAVTALGKIGHDAKEAVDPLIKALSGARTGFAVQAVRALGEIGCADQQVRSALVNLWLSPNQSQTSQIQVAIALCKLKIDAPELVRVVTRILVGNPDASLRKSAAEALAWCNKKAVDVVPALLTAALHDKDERVRETAEAGLVHLGLGHEKAMQLCARQLKDSSYAEAALRNSGPLAIPALIAALNAEEPIIREKAARTLGSIGELAAKAIPALTIILRDKDLDVRLAAAKGLWNITKNAEVVVPVLVHLLGEDWPGAADDGEERRRHLQTVIEALWRIGPPAHGAIAALKEMTRDRNRHIRESALSALKGIAPPGAKKVGW